jgi:hypothetical protein
MISLMKNETNQLFVLSILSRVISDLLCQFDCISQMSVIITLLKKHQVY